LAIFKLFLLRLCGLFSVLWHHCRLKISNLEQLLELEVHNSCGAIKWEKQGGSATSYGRILQWPTDNLEFGLFLNKLFYLNFY
ncbi:hypothetical protein BYT27DRAFT_7162944, partial [Phlegmacium glaucopus]